MRPMTMLEMNHVTFGYKRSVNVLEDFSLSLESGAVYGLLGKTVQAKVLCFISFPACFGHNKGAYFSKGKM